MDGHDLSLGRLAAALAVSLVGHAAAINFAIGAWPGERTAKAPRVILVDLPPARDTAAQGDDGLPAAGPATDTAPAAGVAPTSPVETPTAEQAGLLARLAEEQQRTAQLEAQYRREISALETARSYLGEELAALAADRDALASEVARAQERNAALERELVARREAEQARVAALEAARDQLVSVLRREIADREVALEEARGRLTVVIVDRVLFPSGQSALTPQGERIIDKVGKALAVVADRRVRVEGHTDDVPIGPELRARFSSNWELSTARATEVVKRLIDRARVSPERLSAVGRADTDPVAANDNEDGRRQNRRIEIMLLPPEAAEAS